MVNRSDKKPDAVKTVQAERFSTAGKTDQSQAESVRVIEEVPLTVDVEGVETYTILCTPTDKPALVAGFLFTEGVIDSRDDIVVLKDCDDDPNTVRVRLKSDVPNIYGADRNLLIVSSCGACGSEDLKNKIESLPPVNSTLNIPAVVLRDVYSKLREQQPLFNACGGAHAAAIFDNQGDIVAVAEDAGRHNALDKALGKCVLDGTSTSGLGVALTSRLSLEMISKCVRAGIEIVGAVSAPTSLAVEVADRCNLTLCAFVRETRATVFTHRARILG